MNILRRTALPFAIAALLGAPAYAGSAEEVSMEIDLRAFDLSTNQGAEGALLEIEMAAEQMCDAGSTTTGTRIPSRYARECVESAVKQAVKGLDAPLLVEAYKESLR